jgi:hypothetical protein
MDKLKELLNEFESYITKDWEHRDNPWYCIMCWRSAVFTKEIWIQKIISKEYEFIKWLVENDKIDLDMVKEKLWIPCFTRYSEWKIICVHDVEDYEQLLMLLSIQDNPIEFLISILK